MAIRAGGAYLSTTPRSRKARKMMTNCDSKVGSAAMASVIGMASFAVWSSLAGLLGVLS